MRQTVLRGRMCCEVSGVNHHIDCSIPNKVFTVGEDIAKDGTPMGVSYLTSCVIGQRSMGFKLSSRITNHKSREGVKAPPATVVTRQHLSQNRITKLLVTNPNCRWRDRSIRRETTMKTSTWLQLIINIHLLTLTTGICVRVLRRQTNMLKHVAKLRSRHDAAWEGNPARTTAPSLVETINGARKGYSVLSGWPRAKGNKSQEPSRQPVKWMPTAWKQL